MPTELVIAQPLARVVDPHVTTDRRAQLGIRFAQFDALVARDAAGNFVPALANDWTLEKDARTWRFTVRSDVQFHDGAMLTADHAAASIRRMLDPSLGGELGTTGVIAGYLKGAEIRVLDSHTLEIVTARPMADLLDLLVDLPVVSPSLAGSGPYTVESANDGDVTMRPFPGCWRGAPGYERIRWVAISDGDARVDALLRGEVDLIADVPIERFAGVQAAFPTREQWSPTCVAFLCNTFTGPCTDARVRRALNLGLDKHALIRDAAGGDGEQINGPLTAWHLAYDPETPVYPHDPAAARALLAEAGYADGLAITVDVPTTLPEEAPALARQMAAAWAEIGVTATVREHTNREAYANMVRAKGIGDACCFDSSPLSSFRVLQEKLHSGVAGPWWQGYANPVVDQLLDRAAETADRAASQAIYREAYRLIRDDAPWIFLYRPAYRWAAKPGAVWSPTAAGWIAV